MGVVDIDICYHVRRQACNLDLNREMDATLLHCWVLVLTCVKVAFDTTLL